MDSNGVCATTGVVSVIPVFICGTGLSVESITRDDKVSTNAIDRPVPGAVLMLLLLVYQ